MNIALIGYGKMGKTIEKLALEQGHIIICTIDKGDKNIEEQIKKCDVAIEFTEPNSVIKNLQLCFKNNIPVVTGTTGWYDKFTEITENCEAENGALFYATNFSIGVNIFNAANAYLAKLMNKHNQYSVSIKETHHTQKKDSPSGTAITLANTIADNLDNKTDWKLVNNEPYADNLIPINALRKENVPGTHNILYNSAVDSIELIHTAKNRNGFAQGALDAAVFLHKKKGVYTMSDLLGF